MDGHRAHALLMSDVGEQYLGTRTGSHVEFCLLSSRSDSASGLPIVSRCTATQRRTWTAVAVWCRLRRCISPAPIMRSGYCSCAGFSSGSIQYRRKQSLAEEEIRSDRKSDAGTDQGHLYAGAIWNQRKAEHATGQASVADSLASIYPAGPIRPAHNPNRHGSEWQGCVDVHWLRRHAILYLFVAPWSNFRATGFRWGVGPFFVFPTSTIHVSGEGAWQLGPAAAFGYRGILGWQIAGLFQQATSFAYTSFYQSRSHRSGV